MCILKMYAVPTNIHNYNTIKNPYKWIHFYFPSAIFCTYSYYKYYNTIVKRIHTQNTMSHYKRHYKWIWLQQTTVKWYACNSITGQRTLASDQQATHALNERAAATEKRLRHHWPKRSALDHWKGWIKRVCGGVTAACNIINTPSCKRAIQCERLSANSRALAVSQSTDCPST